MESLPFKLPSLRIRFILVSLPILLAIALRDGHGSWIPPFHPVDILPLLPRQASWAILKYFNSAGDILPVFVGASSSTSSPRWKGACFEASEARFEFHNKSKTEFGGGTLHLELKNPRSLSCIDVFLFVTPQRVEWKWWIRKGKHTLEVDSWEGQRELDYAKDKGMAIFMLREGAIGTLTSLMRDFLPLFVNNRWGENKNLEFLKENMGANFVERTGSTVSDVRVEDIHSGDFLAISKIRSRAGGFQTLQKWVTGTFAGHAAMCLKDPEGKLWVAESGREDEKGEDIIALTTWEEWWNFALLDDSNPHIALLPLHPDMRAKFDATAAWNYAKSMAGKPYGFHNLIFSWIDSVKDNYPPKLDAQLVASSLIIWSKIKPESASRMLIEALNKRLGTEGLDLPQIIDQADKRGVGFDRLLTLPEQDKWTYSDGKSVTCVAFAVQIYKLTGLFGSLADSIQATEFTVKDGYILKFFEDNPNRLPDWCNTGDKLKLPFCQIRGKYWMELPYYNTIKAYANMNEKCPSLPPHYHRPENC